MAPTGGEPRPDDSVRRWRGYAAHTFRDRYPVANVVLPVIGGACGLALGLQTPSKAQAFVNLVIGALIGAALVYLISWVVGVSRGPALRSIALSDQIAEMAAAHAAEVADLKAQASRVPIQASLDPAALEAAQAAVMRGRERHKMLRLDQLLREGDELFAQIRGTAPTDDPLPGRGPEAEARHEVISKAEQPLWVWQRKTASLVRTLYPEVESVHWGEYFVVPGSAKPGGGKDRPEPTWTSYELVDNCVQQFEHWADFWKARMDDYYATVEPARLPPWRRP